MTSPRSTPPGTPRGPVARDGTGFLGFGSRQTWNLALPQEPTLNVNLHLNAASGNVRLAGAHLGTVAVEANAGATRLDLGDAATIQRVEVHTNAGSAHVALPNASLTASLEANAGSIAMCVPADVGIRITMNDNITASNNFAEQGLTRWATRGKRRDIRPPPITSA